MSPLLDKFIIALLITFFVLGWFRGILSPLIGPMSFVICTFFGVIFYDLNKNLVIAAAIIVIGSLATAFGLSALLTLGMATVNKEFRGKTFLVSRILGGSINMLWQGNLVFVALILIAALPAKGSAFEKLQGQIGESQAMRFYYQEVVTRNDKFQAVVDSLFIFQEPKLMDQISSTPEYKAFYQEPHFQAFLDSPEVIKGIETENFMPIVTSPALRTLLANDALMENFTLVAIKIYQLNLSKVQTPKRSQPAVPPAPAASAQ